MTSSPLWISSCTRMRGTTCDTDAGRDGLDQVRGQFEARTGAHDVVVQPITVEPVRPGIGPRHHAQQRMLGHLCRGHRLVAGKGSRAGNDHQFFTDQRMSDVTGPVAVAGTDDRVHFAGGGRQVGMHDA